MPPQTALAHGHLGGQVLIQATFHTSPEHTHGFALHHRPPAAGGRIVQPLPQVRRRGAVMGIHQQAEGLGQFRLAGLCQIPGFDMHRTGFWLASVRPPGTQQKHPEQHPLQGITLRPAHRLLQLHRLPVRRLPVQHLPEPDRKAPPGALIAMHRAGKRHPRPAQQNLPQPARRQTGGLIHHHHLGLRLLRQQLRHRQKTNRLPARQHQLRLRPALNTAAQNLRRMPEKTLQIVHRRRRHQHLPPPRQQQLRRRHPQRRRLAPAPVCRHHHRPPTPPQPETHQPRHQLRLLRRRPRPESNPVTPDIRQHRAFINTLPNPDHRTVRRHNLRQPRQKRMLPRPVQPRAQVIRILKPRPLRQRRHQPEQQPTGPQRTRQPRKPIRRIPLPAIPNQHPGLLPQPPLVLR